MGAKADGGGEDMGVKESQENYLECILHLLRMKGFARSVDIATELRVTKPSVSFAMRQLREQGYILMDSKNLISLTDSGMEVARRVSERHEGIARVLIRMGVDAQTAYQDACRIEHDISQQTFEALQKLDRDGILPPA